MRVTRDYLYNVNSELLEDINKLQEWFPDSRKNGKHYGIKLISEISDYPNKFCTQSGEPFQLHNGKKVAITSQYNNAGTPQNWQEFKDKMAEYDYSIRQCYIFNIGVGPWREWKYCYKYNFIASGGRQQYYTAMDILKKGDIVFVYLAENAPKKGIICYGEVVTDEAKLVSEFVTHSGDFLADCMVDGGQKYKDKFAGAITGNNGTNRYPDKVVGVKWLHSELDEPFSLSRAPMGGSGGYMKRLSVNTIKILQEKFNLGSKESEMISQSSPGNKRSQWFRWKHENDDKDTRTLGVGHTAREAIEHFIKKNSDEKSIEDFKKEFESIKIGSHLRVVSLEDAKKVNKDEGKKYFIEYPVPLKNDKVAISSLWGVTGVPKEQQWKDFKNKMAKLGYSIIVDEESGE